MNTEENNFCSLEFFFFFWGGRKEQFYFPIEGNKTVKHYFVFCTCKICLGGDGWVDEGLQLLRLSKCYKVKEVLKLELI